MITTGMMKTKISRPRKAKDNSGVIVTSAVSSCDVVELPPELSIGLFDVCEVSLVVDNELVVSVFGELLELGENTEVWEVGGITANE